jgi:uncharacterized protein
MKAPAPTHPVIAKLADFDRSSGSWLERLLFNHRIAVLLLFLLITAMLAWQATNIRLNPSFERMIPAHHPFVQNYQQHKADLGGLGNTLRVAVESGSGTIYDAAYLDTLRKLNDELFLLAGVDRSFMKSIWMPAVRWIGVTEEGLDGGPVIPDGYDGSAKSLSELRANIERSGEIGTLVAPDQRSSVIVLPLQETDGSHRLDYLQLSSKLEQLRQRYEAQGVRIHITGFAKVVGDLIEGMHQVLMFFGVALAICTVMLLWYTRCVRSTVLVVSCSLVAALWLLGLLPLLGFDLDPYSILLPFLVFAIGMSHGAQKMNGIMQDIGRGTHKLVAARYTFRRLFLAGLTALLADAVGFAVLMVIDIPVIHDLAISASIGVAVLIFTNLILLPVLLSYLGVSAAAAQRSLRDEEAPRKHPFWAFLDHFTQRRWASLAIVVAAVLAGGGAVVSSHLKIGDLDPGAPELRPQSRYNRDSAFMAAHYAASSDNFVVMVQTPQYLCAQYRTLAQVEALEWRLQQLPGVESTNSFAALSKRASAAMNEGNLKWYDLPRSQDMLNAITTRAPRELLNQNCDLLTVYVYLKDHKADTLDAVVHAVDRFAVANNSKDIQFLSAAGNAGIEAATNIVVRKANTQMLVLVYAAVIVLAFVTFRSWRAVICAILPLMLTSVLCEALMVALGIGVKVATLPVIALGVGIGVDYALYVVSVTLVELRQGASLSHAYYRALQFTGKVVVLTGVTLGAAVATWALSPLKFQADMGILLAFMFIWNMLGALILLPALAHFLLKPTQQARQTAAIQPAATRQASGVAS